MWYRRCTLSLAATSNILEHSCLFFLICKTQIKITALGSIYYIFFFFLQWKTSIWTGKELCMHTYVLKALYYIRCLHFVHVKNTSHILFHTCDLLFLIPACIWPTIYAPYGLIYFTFPMKNLYLYSENLLSCINLSNSLLLLFASISWIRILSRAN